MSKLENSFNKQAVIGGMLMFVGCCNENVTRKMFPLLPAGGGSGVNSANTHFLTREESR